MNTIRLNLALALVAASLASCYTPPGPSGTSTGLNLDRPASGDRSARESRYLEEQVSQAPPALTDPAVTTPVDPNAPVTSDTAAVQAPTGTTPPPPAPTEPSKDTPPPPAANNTGAATPAPAAAEMPYGVPVPGKKGFVYSPYDKSAGFVDVRDIGPGTKVRCPYTGKIFRVP